MAELLQGDNLSEREIALNDLREKRMAEAALYHERLQLRMSEVASPAGVVSTHDSYLARDRAREDVSSISSEQRQ